MPDFESKSEFKFTDAVEFSRVVMWPTFEVGAFVKIANGSRIFIVVRTAGEHVYEIRSITDGIVIKELAEHLSIAQVAAAIDQKF